MVNIIKPCLDKAETSWNASSLHQSVAQWEDF